MTELGVSVYPDLSPITEIEKYLKLAAHYGCTRVFSSMFSVEGSNEEIVHYFKEFIEIAHRFGMKVSLDVNTPFLCKLGLSPTDISLFHEIGCDILRMDSKYTKEDSLKLVNNPYGIQIEFNASTGIAEDLEYFVENHVDKNRVLLCHNFYPQRYTGLTWQKFLDTNRTLRKYGFKMAAFISSHAPNTHGVWDAKDGLPTVEKLRDLPIDLQMREMLATGDVDDILIGNAYASEEEFKALQNVLCTNRKIEDSPIYDIMCEYGNGSYEVDFAHAKKIKVILREDITEIEKNILLQFFPHLDAGDSSEWIWRSRGSRLLEDAKRNIPAKKYTKGCFHPGQIVIVNNNYKHYAGEIQVVLKPILNDGTRNVIAKLAENEMELMELVKDGDVVEFILA